MGYFISKSFNNLIGMDLEEANLYIKRNRIYYDNHLINNIRVIIEDGKSLTINHDHNTNRINVFIYNSIITHISSNG